MVLIMLKHTTALIFYFYFSIGFALASPERAYEYFECEITSPTLSACDIAFAYHDGEPQLLVNELYATELQTSLTRLNRFSLSLYEHAGTWEVSAFVGLADAQLGDDGVYGRNFRSVHFEVPDERVAVFKRNLEEKRLATLVEPMGPVTRTLENGDVVNVICLDDASLRAKYLAPQSVWSVSRHNCRGRTDIDDFADSLFDLAVEFDPTLEPYRFTLPKGD